MGLLKKILTEVAKDALKNKSSKGYKYDYNYGGSHHHYGHKSDFKTTLIKKLFGFVEDFIGSLFGKGRGVGGLGGGSMSGIEGMLSGKVQLTDDKIIAMAAQNAGSLTPAALCMKAQIPIDEAKKKLDHLQIKGVFEIDVDMHGNFVYHLTDRSLHGGGFNRVY